MIYTAEEEQQLMTRIWSPEIRDNPYNFVMFAYPWGQSGTPLEHFKSPRKWQKKLLQKIGDFIARNKNASIQDIQLEVFKHCTVSGRGIGKSAIVSWICHWMATTRIGSTTIISANSESQLRKVTWGELTKWVAMSINSHWFDITATAIKPQAWLDTLVKRDLKKGTRYWGIEGKLWSEESPDSFAGVHNMDGMMVIFDEASGIPDSIWSVAAGFFTENIPDRYWLAFSNGRRNTGYFYEAIEGDKAPFWDNMQVDARDVEGTDKAVYDEIIQEYGEDSDEARVEVYGQFPKSAEDAQLIGEHIVKEAMKRPKYNDLSAPIVIGVDPSRGGDDTVIVVRRGRDLIDLRRFKCPDTMESVGHIIDAINEYKPVFTVVDETGLGGAVVDRLKEQRYLVRGVNFGWSSRVPKRHQNKRVDLWVDMRDWLRTASIPDDNKLRKSLTSVHKKPDSVGLLKLEPKAAIRTREKMSPDDGDALACTFAFPVNESTIRSIVINAGLHQNSSNYVQPITNYW